MINSIKDCFNRKPIHIRININKCINTIKKFLKCKEDEEYEWVYECSMDPRYEGDVCIADKGHLSEPYCKHGLRLMRIKK
jgi:hypothetical protein